MKNYKIVLKYDGGRYNGWQKQGNTVNTIQERIETVLSKMIGSEVEIAGSGRTDAGAHAAGQVANFKLETSMKTEELMDYLNQYLPHDIAVTSIKEMPFRFHSRLNAKKKKYLYRIWNSKIPNVFLRNYMYQCREALNIKAMEEAGRYFLGEHDFKAFCSNNRMKKTTVRTIYDISVDKDGDEIRILFSGNGFLYNMVRIMTGTLIEVGEGKRRPEEIKDILEGRDREKAGFTAPAYGLILMEVSY